MRQTVTVLVPTYRPDRKAGELLRRLTRQSLLPDRVLLINTIPQGGTVPGGDKEAGGRDSVRYLADLADQYGGSFRDFLVFHIDQADFGHGKTRDFGFRNTDTDLVLCMTQDALPRDRKLVENLTKAFEDPQVGAAYARQLAGKKSGPLEREARQFNYPPKSLVKSADDLDRLGVKTFFCSDVCAMWRRALYLQLGGFERDVIFNEDMILAGKMIQAGYRIAYCAKAQVYHSHNYRLGKQIRRNFDLGVSQQDHPEIFRMASSKKEGIRFVKRGAADLIRQGQGALVPEFFLQSGCKLVGYQLGRHYKALPAGLIRRLSDSPAYWEKR